MIEIMNMATHTLVPVSPTGRFPRVVAGIDFSPASLAGARWALTHLARGAELLLAHVVPSEGAPETGEDHLASTAAVAAPHRMAPMLRGGLGGFAATLGVEDAGTVVRAGRPSYWLDRLAAGWNASLVVLGRRQDAKRKRIGEASVVERLTRRTHRPVLVIPEGTLEPPRCIVAAVDEGASGVEVLAAASALATASGLPLVALHVLAPASGTYDRIVGARGRAAVMPVRHAVADAGEGLVLAVGDAAREIVAAGIAHGGGLLVVGKRGADGAPIGSLGSVVRDLLATSPLPVLAIDTSAPAPGMRCADCTA